ncbi:hypothetical protein JOE21_001191 [Desmospora profundinema]|uniref:Uncharacterized protein n=1 Tax=Desmospora profundinema TaxID=1571184 RepID=A0ABU1IK85_9BACL|nr:hypothetical protein [Desmospora profundinema]
MAEHERIQPIIVWESPDQTKRDRDETVIPFPLQKEESDHVVRVMEVPGTHPLRITQVSSGFGSPSQPKSSLNTPLGKVA